MKNSFVVQFATNLLIVSLGLKGILATFATMIITGVLGAFLDRGILVIDLSNDKIREAIKDEHWKTAALKAYNTATAKVYNEDEKKKIRQEYIDALSKYATLSGVVRNDKNT